MKIHCSVDCGKVIDCFSNTLCLENSNASLSPVEIQTVISEVEVEGAHAEQTARIIQENEAANSGAEESEQRPVGTVSEAPAEGTITGRKQERG